MMTQLFECKVRGAGCFLRKVNWTRHFNSAFIFVFLACTISQVQAVSNIPQLINYQGKLTDANGLALATGQYSLEFNIYDSPTAVDALNIKWGPQKFDVAAGKGVSIVDGYFNVILGSVDANNRNILDAFSGDRYLGIKVNGGSEIVPRQKILSTPYALSAAKSEDGSRVGDIIASFLTEAAFQAEHGTTWVLAKGQSAVGSKFQTLTGLSSVPDLRGIFLRGKDNVRGADANGDLALGTYTADKIGPHAHNISQTPHTHPISLGGAMQVQDENDIDWVPRWGSSSTTGANANITILTAGTSITNETSPKAVTVNYFVKIND